MSSQDSQKAITAANEQGSATEFGLALDHARKVIISTPFPPSTNNLFINVAKGRIPSARYADWRQEAGWSLKAQRPTAIKGPVVLRYQFQEGQDKRKRDIGNLEKAPTDLLVEHGVIEADDNTIVRGISMFWSKHISGARVEIIPISKA